MSNNFLARQSGSKLLRGGVEWLDKQAAMASTPGNESVSALLAEIKRGNRDAENRLMELTYAELRRVARRQLASERANHTLQPTALVNEAYLKLMAGDMVWENRNHFLASAATAMRNILVDSARARKAAKRGGARHQVTLGDGLAVADALSVDILDLEEQLKEMRSFDPRSERLIEMRYYGGLSINQAAQVLGISERTAKRDFEAAFRWLRSRLEKSGPGPHP
jgi:RNA polymerase sigma factor (TIGR02999 family)